MADFEAFNIDMLNRVLIRRVLGLRDYQENYLRVPEIDWFYDR